jgi:dipeptidase
MADAHFGDCVADIERYQMKVGAQAGTVINEATNGPASELSAANQRIADMLRRETDAVLAKVLYTASMGMQNGFARSDG